MENKPYHTIPLQNPDFIQILGPKKLFFGEFYLAQNFSHIFFRAPKTHKFNFLSFKTREKIFWRQNLCPHIFWRFEIFIIFKTEQQRKEVRCSLVAASFLPYQQPTLSPALKSPRNLIWRKLPSQTHVAKSGGSWLIVIISWSGGIQHFFSWCFCVICIWLWEEVYHF